MTNKSKSEKITLHDWIILLALLIPYNGMFTWVLIINLLDSIWYGVFIGALGIFTFTFPFWLAIHWTKRA